MVRVTAPAPPPGKPHGHIEDYSFPTSATVDESKAWSMKIHNNGDASGEICAGIANMPGNPGDVEVYCNETGETRTIPPGYILRIYGTRDVCSRVSVSGTVKFKAEGSYTIRLVGGHREDTTWIDDESVDING